MLTSFLSRRFLLLFTSLTLVSMSIWNASPVFTSTPPASVNEGNGYTYQVETSDSDGDEVTITATTLPTWLSQSTLAAGRTTKFAGFGGISDLKNGKRLLSFFNAPTDLAVGPNGALYIADQKNHVIRKISNNEVTTFAGSGIEGGGDGSGTEASFNYPTGIAFDVQGNLYVAEKNGHRIRKITSNGQVTTLAGSGSAGSNDANGLVAEFNQPTGIVADASGNLFVAEFGNHKIRKVDTNGDVTTLAGSGVAGFLDANGTVAKFNRPYHLVLDGSGNLFVTDQGNHMIRKIAPDGDVTTFAGSGTAKIENGTGAAASFNVPAGIAIDVLGNFYTSDYQGYTIRKITSQGVVTTLAGSGHFGNTEGQGTEASFVSPAGLTLDSSGNLYVASERSHRIRRVTTNTRAVFSGSSAGQKSGDHEVVLKADDGNGGTATQTFMISVIDNIEPVLTSGNEVNFQENGTGTVYTATATDTNTITYTLGTGKDENQFDINASTGEVTFKVAPDFELPIDGNADNIYQFTVVAKDPSDNEASRTISVSVTDIDDTKPTLSIISNREGTNSDFSVTFIFSEAVTGFSLDDIQVVNGVADNFNAVNGNWYTALITPSVEGDVTVDVPAGIAQDAAGNQNEAGNQLVVAYDLTSPEIVSVLLDGTPEKGDAMINYKVTFNEKIDSVSVDDFQMALVSGFGSGIVSSATHITDTEVRVGVLVEGSLYNTGDQELRLSLRADHNIQDMAGNALIAHDNSENEVHTTSLTHDTHSGKFTMVLEGDDIPESSPFQLNTSSFASLVPAINSVYPNAPVRVELNLEGFSLNRSFYDGFQNLPWTMDYSATIYALSAATGEYEKAVVMSGVLSAVGTVKGSVGIDGREVLIYKLETINFDSAIIRETSIGPVNTFLLQFKLNLASVGITASINERLSKIEYPLPSIMINEIGFNPDHADSIDYIELYDGGIGNLTIGGGTVAGNTNTTAGPFFLIEAFDSLEAAPFRTNFFVLEGANFPDNTITTDENGYYLIEFNKLAKANIQDSGDPSEALTDRYKISYNFNDANQPIQLDELDVYAPVSAAKPYSLQRYHGNQRVRNDSLEWTYGLPTVEGENRIFLVEDTVRLNENNLDVVDVNAFGGNPKSFEEGITYAISGGADLALFEIDESTGELRFKETPDFEQPGDADTDNQYQLDITASRAEPFNDDNTRGFVIIVKDVDDTPPTVTISSDASDPQSGAFTATFTFSEEVTGFELTDITVGNGVASNLQTISASVYTATITPSADGVVTIHVAADKVVDAVDLGNTAATQLSVTNDETAPVVTITTSLNPTSGAFTATFTFSEEITGFELADITVGNGTASDFQTISTSVYTATITPLADGEVTLDVSEDKAVDAAGNGNTAATQLSVTNDETAPTISITSDAGNPQSGAFTATFTFSEEVTGFELADITVGNGAANNFQTTTASVYTATITPSADGVVTVDVGEDQVTDIAGNDNIAAIQLSVTNDETAPSLSITSDANALQIGVFTATFTFTEEVIGFELADIAVGNGVASNFSVINSSIYTATITPSADGEVTLDVSADKAFDAAGNGNTAAVQLSVTNDETAPALSITSNTGDSHSGAFTATFTFSEGVTGFELADITVGNSVASDFSVINASIYTATITPSADGEVSIDVAADKALDLAGNLNKAAVQFTLINDETTPSVSLSAGDLNEGAYLVTAQFSETIVGFVQGDITVTGGTVSDFTEVDGDTYTFSVSSENPSATVDIVAGVVTDAAGNENTGASQLSLIFNSSPTDIELSNASIDENNEAGAAIGDFSTTDPDASDSHTYTLLAGAGDTDNASFTIDGTSLKATGTFDFETQSSYSIRVKTDDGRGGIFEKNFTISIDNVAEPEVTVSGTVDFPETQLGITVSTTITISNIGEAPVEVIASSVPADFSVTPGSVILMAGESRQVNVNFTPTQEDTYSGNLIFTYYGRQTTLPVSGVGAIVTGIDDELIDENEISLYPNPTGDIVNIDLSQVRAAALDIVFINPVGKAINTWNNYRYKQLSVRVSNLDNGLYIMQFTDGKSVIRKKVIIRK